MKKDTALSIVKAFMRISPKWWLHYVDEERQILDVRERARRFLKSKRKGGKG